MGMKVAENKIKSKFRSRVRGRYSVGDLQYSIQNYQALNNASNVLGVDLAAIVGSIAEEAHAVQHQDVLNQFLNCAQSGYILSGIEGFRIAAISVGLRGTQIDQLVHNKLNDEVNFLNNLFDPTIADRSLMHRLIDGPEFTDKLAYISLNDVGDGNIKLQTAVNALRHYAIENPNDPLGLSAKYGNNYGLLFKDLTKGDASAYSNIAAAITDMNRDFFQDNFSGWGSLSISEQNTLLVTAYNLGTEKLTVNKNRDEAAGKVWVPKPGDEGKEYLANEATISEILVGIQNGNSTDPLLRVAARDRAFLTHRSRNLPASEWLALGYGDSTGLADPVGLWNNFGTGSLAGVPSEAYPWLDSCIIRDFQKFMEYRFCDCT